MKLRVIYLDVDGVLVNFPLGAIRAHLRKGSLKLPHGTYYEPDDSHKIASNEFWPPGLSLMKYLGITDPDKFWEPINGDPLFWRGLPPYPWYKRIVELCEDYCDELVLCTSPSSHHHSWGGKALWLLQHDLGHLPCIMMNEASATRPRSKKTDSRILGKWMLAAPDRLLIDDYKGNTIPFAEAGGQSLLFPQPWNVNHPHMNDPVSYVADFLSKLTEPGNGGGI